jgi:hypothetical protein
MCKYLVCRERLHKRVDIDRLGVVVVVAEVVVVVDT